MVHRDPSSPTPMPTILRYGIAVLSVAIAIGLDFFLLRHFDAKLTPFLFAVAATVWYAGTGPGVLAIVLSVLSLNYFFLRPFSFSPISYADLVYLTFCTFCALAVGWVSAVRRRAEQELRQVREELEAKVLERTASLQRSEGYLAEALKLTHTGSWAWDPRTEEVLYCSEEMFRIFGLDPRESSPSRDNFRQQIHPEDRDWLKKRFEESLRERVDTFAEYRVLLPDGTVRHINASGHPVLNEDGEFIEFIGTATDVTERKRTEQALRESEYRHRQIIDTVPSLLWSTGPDGEPTYISQRLLDYSGMRVEDFKHGGWEAFVHPADFPDTAKAFYHAIQTGTSYQTVHRLRRADGEYRWHQARGEPLHDREGRIVQWYGLSVDIDEGKRAEERLRRSETYLAEAQRLSHSGVSAYNETSILYGSEEIYRIWGFDPAQGVPSREAVFQRIHPDDRDRLNAEVQRAVSEKRGYTAAYRIVLPDGTIKHLETIGRPGFSASGELVEIVTTQIDVTERKCAEEALRAVEAEARENERRYREVQLELAHANRLATTGQLTASITHEVNQPITAAVTYALAARRFLSAEPPNLREVDDALSLIVKEGNRAGEVVGRIRALIKKAPARKDAVEINDAILEVIALTRAEAANNGVSVRTQLAEGLPRVQGDRVQLQQVLLNLIINAIEAMHDVGEDERELLISTRSDPDGVSVEVRDSGPGFVPADLDRLFEAFYTTKSSGMGLGLSICRSIIAAHNGRLWASPNAPRGAVFHFIAPAHPADAS
ncbi:PAS domain S-box-containing protein [Bradyrhizobium niftali]